MSALLPVMALLAILGGPRLAEAYAQSSRRAAESRSQQHKKSHEGNPTEKPKSQERPATASFEAACVAKTDGDGRTDCEIATSSGPRIEMAASAPIQTIVGVSETPTRQLHQPPYHALAPPAHA